MDPIQVPVSGGKHFALIDAEDADRVLMHKWCAFPNRAGSYYVHRRMPKAKGGKFIKLHRFLMGLEVNDGMCVDHINGDTLDNRKSNLRVCKQGENMRNYRHAWGNEGVRGITKTAQGKFRARIRYNRALYEIGSFDTLHDASVAYAFASSLLHGEFGSLPGHDRFVASPVEESFI